MKRFIILPVVAALILAAVLAPPALARPADITVTVDGQAVAFDVPPVMREGRVLVPFRAVADILNVAVTWDEGIQTVHATDNVNTLLMRIGDRTARLNGARSQIDVPPLIINGRTLIPLRVFGGAFGCTADWDQDTGRVTIVSPAPPQPMTVIGFYALGDSRTSSWTDLFGRAYPETAVGRTGIVTELALGWYSLDPAGRLLTQSVTGWQRPDGWEQVLAAAAEYELGTEMVVHMTDRDGELESLIDNPEAIRRAVSEIGHEAALFDGVNLDLEGLGLNASREELTGIQQNFTAFASQLATELRAKNKRLTLTLHPPNSAYRGYDYRSLGTVADRIIIMAYDYGPRPEPDHLVAEAVEKAVAVVPPHKLILGISAPGERPDSIHTRVRLARQQRLDGIALWRLGLVSNEMWSGLQRHVNP